MNRRFMTLISAILMLGLAVVVARVFREPVPDITIRETAFAPAGDEFPAGTMPLAVEEPGPSSGNLPLAFNEPVGDEQIAGASSPVPAGGAGSFAVAGAPFPLSGDALSASPAAVEPVPDESPAPAPLPGDAPPVPPAVVEPVPDESPAADESPVPAPFPGGAPPVPPAVVEPVPDESPAPDESSVPVLLPDDAPPVSPAVVEPAPPPPAPERAAPVRPGTLVTRTSLPPTGGNVVTSAVLTMDGNVVTLRLEGNAPLKGNAFLLADPDRAVLDLAGVWEVSSPRVSSNRMIRSLRAGTRESATRLVFDMRVKPQRITLEQVSPRILELRIR